MNSSSNRTVATTVVILLVAWFVFGLVRFAVLKPQSTHYHADFAVYINGEREQFDNFNFYEEVTQCSASGDDATPEGRVHMHDNVNSIVHVHDELVTWSHFFSSLDWGLTNVSLTTWGDVFDSTGEDADMKFVQNGEIVDTLANDVIGHQDKVVISYGDVTDEEILGWYDQLDSQAAEFNQEQDPTSCSGDQLDTATRLKNAFFFTD